MAFRNDFRRTVILGGVVDRPERADAERGPWPGNFCASIVGVPRLYGFAGMKVDREHGRKQAGMAELGFGKRQRQRVNCKLRKNRRFGQQRIYTVRLFALEIVAALEVAREIRSKRRADLGDLSVRQHPLENY